MHHCKALPKPVSIEFYRSEPSLPRPHDKNVCRKEPGGACGTPFNGLCQKAPPDRGNFFRVQVNERVENQRHLQMTTVTCWRAKHDFEEHC